MPRALCLLLLLAVARAADVFVIADTANETLAIADAVNETIAEATDVVLSDTNDTLTDGDHEPIVRKKRTFGDIVFRGLADVLGYNVARKPPQTFVFPPPVGPVPGIDTPVQAAAVAPPAAPAPAPAPAPPPCGAPRAAAPPPCRARQPPAPAPAPKPRPPPCPKPRAAPRPKPTRPPPPPPPPCASPRANPTTAAPCTAPAQPKADSNLETISSNFRLNFNFNRALATPTPAANDDIAEEEAPQEQAPIAPIAIQPRAAKLPPPAPRNPRVYVDAFVVRDGVPQRVHTIDAKNINRPQVADDDYLFDVDEEPQNEQRQQDQLYDDYEDVQESRDRAKAVREFGTAVDKFWAQKQKPKQKLPANDYRKVHFGDRDLANQLRRRSDENPQSLQRERARADRDPSPLPDDTDGEEESEVTTTTQDPRRKLKPRVLPPTEHNPNQIDTVTVRVPPIYKEKRPKKLHRERPEAPDRDEDSAEESPREEYQENDFDADSEESAQVERTEPPKRRRRRKKSRRVRSTFSQAYTAGDYDYYGKKLPISEEEEHYRTLTVPPPTKDADLARLEEADDEGHFLDDHERLREDPERIQEKKKPAKEVAEESRHVDRESDDESERSDENERSSEDKERASEAERSDSQERTDKLSPNARVRETGYKSNYVRATNVQVDDPQPNVSVVKRKNKTLKNKP